VISASFARDEVATGRVKLIELEGAELWRELGIAYRRDRTLSVATKTFVTVVRQLSDYLKRLKPRHRSKDFSVKPSGSLRGSGLFKGSECKRLFTSTTMGTRKNQNRRRFFV